jgi:acyl-CoA thioesterase
MLLLQQRERERVRVRERERERERKRGRELLVYAALSYKCTLLLLQHTLPYTRPQHAVLDWQIWF